MSKTHTSKTSYGAFFPISFANYDILARTFIAEPEIPYAITFRTHEQSSGFSYENPYVILRTNETVSYKTGQQMEHHIPTKWMNSTVSYTPSSYDTFEEGTLSIDVVNSANSAAIATISMSYVVRGYSGGIRLVSLSFPTTTFNFTSNPGVFTNTGSALPARFRPAASVYLQTNTSNSTGSGVFLLASTGIFEVSNATLAVFTASTTWRAGTITFIKSS